MADRWLHWQARLGANKLLASLIAITMLLFLGMLHADLENSIDWLNGPVHRSLAELNEPANQYEQYVHVSGTALFDRALKRIDNGRVTMLYYPLIDERTDTTLWIRSAHPRIDIQKFKPQQINVSGMFRQTSPLARKWLDANTSMIESTGAPLTTWQLDAEQTPLKPWLILPLIIGLSITLLLSVLALICPAIVFAPAPIEPASIFETGAPGVRVAGRFHRLRHLEPWIEFADAARNFRPAVAELLRLENRHLMVLARYTSRSRRETTQWGVLIEPARLIKIEPGKLYGWRDRWAVRIEYYDQDWRTQSLIVSFNHSGAQAEFVERLKQMGYDVSEPRSEKA